jgi:hypothetical protein
VAVEPLAVAGIGRNVDVLGVDVPAPVVLEVSVVPEVATKLKVVDGIFWFKAFEELLARAPLML